METFKYRLGTLPKDSRNTSPTRNHHKVKQTRKTSTISVPNDGKTKSRISKHRSSLAKTTQQTSDSNDGNHLSTFEELPAERENKSDEAAQQFTQMTLDEGQIPEHSQRNKATGSREDESPEGAINLTAEEGPNSTEEEEQKGMNLGEKLAQDYAFNIIGVMNLSSMNLTDHDIPMIIQRAFHDKKKKCFGLILRDNALTSEGVKTLVDTFLTMRTKLTYLSFADNPDIGDAGIEHLTRLLQKNRSLNFLAVPNTGVTDRGVRILADTLCGINTDSRCAPLEKLYLSFNKLITDESLEAILQIMECNKILEVLSLRNCSLSNKARRQLRQVGTKMKKRKFSLAD